MAGTAALTAAGALPVPDDANRSGRKSYSDRSHIGSRARRHRNVLPTSALRWGEGKHEKGANVGLSILASTALDYRGNFRNLVRADLMAIGSLYFLTLFEFLTVQTAFDDLLTLAEVRP